MMLPAVVCIVFMPACNHFCKKETTAKPEFSVCFPLQLRTKKEYIPVSERRITNLPGSLNVLKGRLNGAAVYPLPQPLMFYRKHHTWKQRNLHTGFKG